MRGSGLLNRRGRRGGHFRAGVPPVEESVRWRRGEQQDLKPVYQDNCDTIKNNIFNHTFTSVLSVLDHDPFSTKATSFNYG